jgi:hypothetical protein
MAATSAAADVHSVELGERYVFLGLNIIRNIYGKVNVFRYARL